jgi:hypothetical protein
MLNSSHEQLYLLLAIQRNLLAPTCMRSDQKVTSECVFYYLNIYVHETLYSHISHKRLRHVSATNAMWDSRGEEFRLVFTPTEATCLHVRREHCASQPGNWKMRMPCASQNDVNNFPTGCWLCFSNPPFTPDLAPRDFNSLDHWRSTSKENSSQLMMWWKTVGQNIESLFLLYGNRTCCVQLVQMHRLVWRLRGEVEDLSVITYRFGHLRQNNIYECNTTWHNTNWRSYVCRPSVLHKNQWRVRNLWTLINCYTKFEQPNNIVFYLLICKQTFCSQNA